MCLARKHVDFLEITNEQDFRSGRVSYETYLRFGDIAMRCRQCERCDNGEHADILPECRVHFLRFFISMKKDGEKWRIAQQRAAKAAEEAALGEVQVLASNE